jgi:hypothetical protein
MRSLVASSTSWTVRSAGSQSGDEGMQTAESSSPSLVEPGEESFEGGYGAVRVREGEVTDDDRPTLVMGGCRACEGETEV